MVAQPELAAEGFRAILEGLPTGVYLVDRDRRIVFWNDGCERITGFLRHEVIGRSSAQDLLMHCDERADSMCGSACPLLATMRDGRPREAHVFLRHRHGQRLPVLVRAVPVRDEAGAIIGACESFDQFPFPLPRPRLVKIESPPPPADELTGLPGREAVLQQIRFALESFQTSHLPFGILCLGIDNPEQIRAKDGAIGLNQILYATAQTLHANSGRAISLPLAGRPVSRILHGSTSQSVLESALFLKRLAALEAVPWWSDQLTTTLSAAGTGASGRHGTNSDRARRSSARLADEKRPCTTAPRRDGTSRHREVDLTPRGVAPSGT